MHAHQTLLQIKRIDSAPVDIVFVPFLFFLEIAVLYKEIEILFKKNSSEQSVIFPIEKDITAYRIKSS